MALGFGGPLAFGLVKVAAINKQAWKFLASQALASDPEFERFRQDGGR